MQVQVDTFLIIFAIRPKAGFKNKVELQANVSQSANSINKVRQKQVEETRNTIKTKIAINNQRLGNDW